MIKYRNKYLELLKEIRDLPKSKRNKQILSDTIEKYVENLKSMQCLWVLNNIKDEEGTEQLDEEYDSETESNESEEFEDSETDSEPMPKRRRMLKKNLEHESDTNSKNENSESEVDLDNEEDSDDESESETERDSSSDEDGFESGSDLDNDEDNEMESEPIENEDSVKEAMQMGYDAYHKGFHKFYTMFEDVINEKGRWARKKIRHEKREWDMD